MGRLNEGDSIMVRNDNGDSMLLDQYIQFAGYEPRRIPMSENTFFYARDNSKNREPQYLDLPPLRTAKARKLKAILTELDIKNFGTNSHDSLELNFGPTNPQDGYHSFDGKYRFFVHCFASVNRGDDYYKFYHLAQDLQGRLFLHYSQRSHYGKIVGTIVPPLSPEYLPGIRPIENELRPEESDVHVADLILSALQIRQKLEGRYKLGEFVVQREIDPSGIRCRTIVTGSLAGVENDSPATKLTLRRGTKFF